MNILLIRLRMIGDVVFTTPAIRALRRRFPEARLTYLVEHAAAHEREHRVRLVAGLRHCENVVAELAVQTRDEIGRQERRIARHGHHERMRGGLEARVQPGERAGEAAKDVRVKKSA